MRNDEWLKKKKGNQLEILICKCCWWKSNEQKQPWLVFVLVFFVESLRTENRGKVFAPILRITRSRVLKYKVRKLLQLMPIVGAGVYEVITSFNYSPPLPIISVWLTFRKHLLAFQIPRWHHRQSGSWFLVACTQLYMWLCRLVGQLVDSFFEISLMDPE